ncbi:hypothetical protein [Parvularcula maris]|uniref:Nuclear transport factor 2 family protein n=1 Tax=Parvularcula maris TaxID=2965077 RepID=A0A9X2L7C9_9PROT|nr:hypothetical protein [Parvularcula maris]MCQ8184392.1 hypothetical protein [Parvularcula maris]
MTFLLLAALAATNPEEAVLQTVDRFFEAYYARDAEAGAETITATASGRQVSIGEDAEPTGISAPIDVASFVAAWSDLPTKNAELYWEPKVQVTEGLAQVFAPYVIEVDRRIVHCGFDAFTLIEVEGTWKIDTIQFTAEPTGCARLGYDPLREDLRPASLRPVLSGEKPK